MAEREQKELQFSAHQYREFFKKHPIWLEFSRSVEAYAEAQRNRLCLPTNTHEEDLLLKGEILGAVRILGWPETTIEQAQQRKQEVDDGSGN